jgi:serine/threonine protein kinase
LSARNSHDSTSVDPTQVLFHEKVGAGGSADIFSGSVNGLGLAIKCYRQPISDDPLDDDLMHEISICKDLQHPRILRYIGFSIENQFSDRKLMMLMELCRGTVHQLIRSSNAIDQLEILRQVAEGLSYLHAQNVIHRDIKSENIFYSSRLNRETMKQEFDFKIGDFDVAVKCFNGNLEIEDVPNLGTLEFRAPEIIRASSSESVCYTDRVDIWAFGMLIFELVAKDIPYRSEFGMELSAIERAIVSGTKPSVPKKWKKKQRIVQNLYDSCLSIDPITRPSSINILDLLLRKEKEEDSKTLDHTSSSHDH